MVYFAPRIGIGGTAIALEPCSVFVTHFSLLIPNTYHLSHPVSNPRLPFPNLKTFIIKLKEALPFKAHRAIQRMTRKWDKMSSLPDLV